MLVYASSFSSGSHGGTTRVSLTSIPCRTISLPRRLLSIHGVHTCEVSTTVLPPSSSFAHTCLSPALHTYVLHALLNHHALVEPRLRSTYPLTHRHVVLPLLPVHPHLHGHGSSSSGRLKVLGTLEWPGEMDEEGMGERIFLGDDEDVGKNATRMSVSAPTAQRMPVIASIHPLLLRSPSFLSLILDTRFPALRA
ncbi:hypothetical protein Hypma_004261 [Hypsizygus marmoreus]|uniref:Uncharacterized protein n=1 Tax=Hypsizygus marmoreus TaxID=39966 RepID=A0A369J0J1_HYPMA|nr:hypothetical protein Hypma_004261 [Hypsizygus marmoreus]